MNKKGNIGIPSNRAILAIIFILVIIGVIYVSTKNIDISPLEENQQKISDELSQKTDTIVQTVNNQKTAIDLLNKNMEILENKVDTNSQELQQIGEDIKTIEPTSVQNVDINDLRTYFNIFNFRLVINFFVALSLSLFSIELIKIFGDFLSFTKHSNNPTWNNYWAYRKYKKNIEVKVFQEYLRVNAQKEKQENDK
jgi:hypothetical protein